MSSYEIIKYSQWYTVDMTDPYTLPEMGKFVEATLPHSAFSNAEYHFFGVRMGLKTVFSKVLKRNVPINLITRWRYVILPEKLRQVSEN